MKKRMKLKFGVIALIVCFSFIYIEKFEGLKNASVKRVSNEGIIGEAAIVINEDNGEWLY